MLGGCSPGRYYALSPGGATLDCAGCRSSYPPGLAAYPADLLHASAAACAPCSPGYFAAGESLVCVACVAGAYSGPQAAACAFCSTGQFQAAAGAPTAARPAPRTFPARRAPPRASSCAPLASSGRTRPAAPLAALANFRSARHLAPIACLVNFQSVTQLPAAQVALQERLCLLRPLRRVWLALLAPSRKQTAQEARPHAWTALRVSFRRYPEVLFATNALLQGRRARAALSAAWPAQIITSTLGFHLPQTPPKCRAFHAHRPAVAKAESPRPSPS